MVKIIIIKLIKLNDYLSLHFIKLYLIKKIQSLKLQILEIYPVQCILILKHDYYIFLLLVKV